MENDSYIVIEGVHKNPNNIDTIDESTKKIHGPFDQKKANDFAKGLIQKNIDNFYHRAWVVKEGLKLMICVKNVKRKTKALSKIL